MKRAVQKAVVITICAVLCRGVWADPGQAGWRQWGGPQRNFTVETDQLAEQWPDDGPKRLWTRKLGSGFSAIVVDEGVLYTMYRKQKKNMFEQTIALDARTGKTVWEKRNKAKVPDSVQSWGKDFSGPNATPLIAGERLFTVGRNATIHCRQKKDGEVLWTHELSEDFGAQLAVCGFSPSPIAFENTIIVPVGHAQQNGKDEESLVAFDQASGDVVWRSQTFEIDHSSPILIDFEGDKQLVVFAKGRLIGVDPNNGAALWEHRVDEQDSRVTPVWNGKDTLFFSGGDMGWAIKLAKNDGGTSAEMMWASNKAPLGWNTPVLFGDLLVGGKRGDHTRGLFMGVDFQTGKRLWAAYGFPMAGCVGGGDKLVILDHKGKLTLATVTPENLTIRSEFQLTEQESLTVPTLVGTTLYVRDEKNIMALDLGVGATG